ncbi:MAG: hypothetical protein GY725_01725 [bacterium]|nr:hypothetical protein [bacterium]
MRIKTIGFTGLAVLALVLFVSEAAQGAVVFSDNFNATVPNDDINPGATDEPGRQSGSAAPLDYLEDPDTGLGGIRPNLTQVNNPDYPDAILLAPSTQFGFEQNVHIQPDHDFLEAPGANSHMTIRFDANPVHPTSGVQVAGAAPIVVGFLHGLEFRIFDGGEWGFTGDGAFTSSGDLDPGDAGGLGGSFEGFHTVEVALETDAFVFGNSLDVSVRVDGVLVAIDTDATPTVFESAIVAGPANLIVLSGRTDPTAPATSGGFTTFTLHGLDNLEIETGPVPIATPLPGLARLLLAVGLLACAIVAIRVR